MRPFRVIPVLLLGRDRKLVKTTRFRNPSYIGDPINTIRIFNDKAADELCILDIEASAVGRGPDLQLVSRMVSESFMPISYGGGVRTLDDIHMLLRTGVERVVLGCVAAQNPDFVRQASDRFGSSTIVVSIDLRKRWWGKTKATYFNARRSIREDPLEFAQKMQALGAGEILLNDVDRDGMLSGYGTEQIKKFTAILSIPLIANCGASSAGDLVDVCVTTGASAAAAAGLFVYQGPHKAVLISYPAEERLLDIYEKLARKESNAMH